MISPSKMLECSISDSRREPDFGFTLVVPAELPSLACTTVEAERRAGETARPIITPMKIPAPSSDIARTIELSMNR